MARKNALPEKEKAICRRLLTLRQGQKLSRTALAEILKIDRDRLAQYDYERVPVPYVVGRAACQALCVNQRWLATGRPPKFPFVEIAEIDLNAPPGAYFSEIYERLLAPHLESHAATAAAALAGNIVTEEDSDTVKHIAGHGSMAQTLEKLMDMAINGMLYHLPESLQSLYAQKMVEASRRFADEHDAEIDAWWEKYDREFEQSQKSGVDIIATSQYSRPMPRTLEDLLKAVEVAASGHGKQKELAKAIGVSSSQLSRWINGEGKPNAQATLKLLSWVEEAEQTKTKSPGSADTPPEQMAQTERNQGNETKQFEPGKQSPRRPSKSTSQRRKGAS